MTSRLKLDKADQEVVTDSGSADDSDSVSGSELARKKTPHFLYRDKCSKSLRDC